MRSDFSKQPQQQRLACTAVFGRPLIFHQKYSKKAGVTNEPCEPLSAFRFFCFLFFGASAWHRKPPQVYSSVVYTPRHAKTSSHSHPQKQSLGLRHNKGLACIPPARSWLLLRVIWQAGLVKVASLFGRQFSS